MRKVKNRKKLFWHNQRNLKAIRNNFFLFLLKVKIIVSVLCAYANKVFRQQNSEYRAQTTKFVFNPKVAYVERLYGEKITRIQDIDISHFDIFTFKIWKKQKKTQGKEWREGREQRWASNARHRSNIRAPPRPLPPDICIQSVGICIARGAGSDS